MTQVATPTSTLHSLVDAFAELHATINRLQAESDALKAQLIASGEVSINGTFVRAAITTSKPPVKVDYKAVVAELDVPQDVIAAHTSLGKPTTSVRLYAL